LFWFFNASCCGCIDELAVCEDLLLGLDLPCLVGLAVLFG